MDGSEAQQGAGRSAAAVGLCVAATHALAADGASMALMSAAGHSALIASTNALADQLYDLQATLGEGPVFEAFAEGHPVLASDITTDESRAWPEFSRAAGQSRARGLFVFPLRIGAVALGVLSVHRTSPGMLARHQLAEGLRLADLAGHLVVDLLSALRNGGSGAGNGDGAARYESEDFLSSEIHQASGMVMVQLGVPIEEALARLRALAFVQERPLRDVARDVVLRRLRLEP